MRDITQETGVNLDTFFKWGMYIAALILGFWELIRRHMKRGVKKPVEKEAAKPPLNYKQTIAINQLLIELRTETKADRVQIHLFQNGEHYIVSNTSVQRFSCAHEKVRTGIAPVAHVYGKCLISTYIDGLSQIVDAAGGVVKITRADVEDGMYKTAMINTGAQLHVGISLAWRGDVIGFLLVTYMDENIPADRCSFSALVDQGMLVDTDTKTLVNRKCTASCVDCHYREYIMQIEALLAQGE